MIYEKMTNDDNTLMSLMNSNLVMYVPRASVLLHTGDESPKPVMNLVPPTAEERGRHGGLAYSAFKAAEAEVYRQIGQWEKTHVEFIKYFGGLVIPVPNIVAKEEHISTENGAQRCYLVVATDCPKEARRMPLFVRSLEMCVVEDLARPITKENFFAAKDALDTIFKNPPIGKHKPERDQAKQRVYVHRLFLPCMQKKNSELVEVSKMTKHIAESTKRAIHLSLDTPELPIDQISVRPQFQTLLSCPPLSTDTTSTLARLRSVRCGCIAFTGPSVLYVTVDAETMAIASGSCAESASENASTSTQAVSTMAPVWANTRTMLSAYLSTAEMASPERALFMSSTHVHMLKPEKNAHLMIRVRSKAARPIVLNSTPHV